MLKISLLLRNLETSRANNSRIIRIYNATFSGYCFYINRNIQGDFQICISVPLSGFPSMLLQLIIVWDPMQVSKLLETQADKMSHRKRIYVCIIFGGMGTSTHVSFHPPTPILNLLVLRKFIYLLIYLPIYLFIYLFTYLFIYLFTYLSIYLFIYLFIYVFIFLSIHLFIHSFIYQFMFT